MSPPLRVLFLPGDAGAAEERAARAWLESRADVALSGFAPDEADVVWAHASVPVAPDDPAWAPARRRIGTGGVLFTLMAAALPFHWGTEVAAPAEVGRRIWRDEDDDLAPFDDFSVAPRIRGHAALRSHPLFAGLDAGVYTWSPRDGEAFTRLVYRRPAWPERARVVAVERSYIRVNPACATIWVLDPEEAGGAVLCIGAYLYFAAPAASRRAGLEHLTVNALLHAAGRPAGAATPARYWRSGPVGASGSPAVPVPEPPAVVGAPTLPDVGPALEGAAEGPFTLAGRRAFLAGDEAGGVTEIWVHPLRVLKVLALDVDGAPARAARVRATPVGFERMLAGGALTERLFVPRDAPGASLAWTAGRALELSLEWVTDLRLMWPYPAGALGSLYWHRQGRAWTVRAAEGDVALFALSREPDAWSAADVTTPGAPAVRFLLRVRLAAGETLRLALVAGDGGAAGERGSSTALGRTLETVLRTDGLAAARAGAARRLARDRLAVTTPEPEVDAAVEWAKHRLDAFRVETPGVGRSLVAGYWTSRPGWGDGRPGYAWYFGRDAVWTALGSLAVGDFDAVRDVIRFLGAHQDDTGKILHECTTSGLVHYDAADATPLYLLLAARYLAWTGDAGLLTAEWPRIRAAWEHCLRMDHDGDGLIENTGEGHGWVEFGRLGGATATCYNASIWAAALGELAVAAETLGDAGWALELKRRHGAAREALERVFYDGEGRRYALNVSRDEAGGWRRNMAQTAMQAVPLLLGVADAGRADAWLDAIAGPDFAAAWGVRLVPLSDPEYDPESYHGGAVWPLFTGWASWASFAAGRPEAGHRLWRMNVARAFRHERGAWPEVLHGTEERPAGVCPDQAWSTAMAVAPLVYGLLGAEPDAPRGRLVLRPRPPAAWPRFEVRGLRLGDAAVSLSYHRDGRRHTFRVEQERGSVPLTLVFEPALPGRRLAAAWVDGQPAELDARPLGADAAGTKTPEVPRLQVPLQLVLDHARTVVLELVSDEPASASASGGATETERGGPDLGGERS